MSVRFRSGGLFQRSWWGPPVEQRVTPSLTPPPDSKKAGFSDLLFDPCDEDVRGVSKPQKLPKVLVVSSLI